MTTMVVDNNDEDSGDDDDDDEVEIECRWKWSKWKTCTKSCNTGNTTRMGLCVCAGFGIPFPDSECADVPNPLGTEVVTCNQHKCGQIAACNKICWMGILDQNVKHNITDGIFQCSLGCPSDDTCPKGKTFSQVLTEQVPAMAANEEWYYLAKEWYAAILNQAAGFSFPPLAIQAINQASQLLENCDGWGPNEMKLLAFVYSVKEKLNRANNEIGGLDDVDDQVASMVGGDNSQDMDNGESQKSTILAVAISVPMAAIAIISVAIMFSIYYARRKTYVVVQPNEAHVPESTLVDHGTGEVPLQDQQKGEDSSSEEKI